MARAQASSAFTAQRASKPSLVTAKKISETVQSTTTATGDIRAANAATTSKPTPTHGRTRCASIRATSVPGSTSSG